MYWIIAIFPVFDNPLSNQPLFGEADSNLDRQV